MSAADRPGGLDASDRRTALGTFDRSGANSPDQAAGQARADGEASVEDLRRTVGTRLRELREAKRMSLRSVAAECGVTSGFLSQIENAHVMPSVASLVRLCACLGVEVGDVFAPGTTSGRLVRMADRVKYRWAEAGIRDERVSADPSRRLEVLHSYFEPGGSTGSEPFAHGADVEVALALRGTLIVRVGDQEYELHPGDAVTFDGGLPHSVRNAGKEPAEIIWVTTPASF